MKKIFLLVSLLVASISFSWVCAGENAELNLQTVTPPADLDDYYSNVDNKSGMQLFDAIHSVACVGFSTLGYNGLWAAYAYTDCKPETNIIWDMYSDHCDFVCGGPKQGHNYSQECDGYNREHSIPKSWFGGSTSGMGCDIFHLVPTDGWVNNKRGNMSFGEVKQGQETYTSHNGSKIGPNAIAGYNETIFEPIDEFKGDFARGYIGTMIKWEHSNMSQGEGASIFTSNYTQSGGYGLTTYGIALLMKWHRQDPVSQKEIDRNNGIQQTQGNRNPFIDYPYLAEYIWGEKSGQTVNMAELMGSFEEDFVPGESNGWRGSVTAIPVWEQPSETAQKMIINGKLYIIREGVTYDIYGRR